MDGSYESSATKSIGSCFSGFDLTFWICLLCFQEGKKINQKDSVADILKQLCREQYTLEELRARPLPEGEPLTVCFHVKSNCTC